jgi:formate-dependent nitrite reductase membrane component NrfD
VVWNDGNRVDIVQKMVKWDVLDSMIDILRYFFIGLYYMYKALSYAQTITTETIARAYMNHPILWTIVLSLSLSILVLITVLCCKGLKRLFVPISMVICSCILFVLVAGTLIRIWVATEMSGDFEASYVFHKQ